MRRFRFELILGALLLVACALIWRWQAPASPLTGAEIEAYLNRLEGQSWIAPAERADFLARLRAFGERDDGTPAYLVNLMRYHSEIQPVAGFPADVEGGPAEANAYYESRVLPLALGSGSLPIFTGNVDERNVTTSLAAEDRWSRIAVMRYPSRRAFFDLLVDPRYERYAPYKLSALHVALVPATAEMVLPEIRHLAVTASLIAFLSVGWIRAVRLSSGG